MGRSSGLSGRALFAVVLWGVSFVLTREALTAFTPFGLVAVRLALGSAMLVLFAHWGGGRLMPVRSDLPVCLVLGLILAAHFLIQAHGLQHTSAIHTAWIIGAIPIPLAVGAHLLGQQRMVRSGWIGLVIGLAGVFIVTGSAMPDFENARWGDGLQLVSCLTWTVYTLAGTGPVGRSGPLAVTTLAMIVAAAVVALAGPMAGIWVGPASSSALIATAVLGVLCSGLAMFLWFSALDTHGPARIGVLLFLEPLVTVIAAVLIGDERVTVGVCAGGLFILVGAWQASRKTSLPPPSLDALAGPADKGGR